MGSDRVARRALGDQFSITLVVSVDHKNMMTTVHVTVARSVTFLAFLELVLSDCGVPIITDGAEDLVTASFKKGLHLTDFTKIEVSIIPYYLVEDGACISGDRMRLQYKSGPEEEWTTVEVKPTFQRWHKKRPL